MPETRKYYDPNMGGTDRYWRISRLGNLVMTDSVKEFCDEHEAYWLMDVINSYYLTELKKVNDDFFIIYCDVDKGKAKVYIRQDTDMPDVVKQRIPFTDLDVSVKFYLSNNVVMFPSDY